MTLLNIPELFGFSIEVYFILLIIAIPTFYFWRWLLKRFTKVSTTRRVVTWFATIIMTPIIYSILIIIFIFSLTYEPNRDFNKSQWMGDREGRFQMAKDIIKSKMLIDKDSNQVKQLIGEPNWEPDSLHEWSYDMGAGGGLGFTFHNLKVKFFNSKVILVEHQKVKD